jgi:hypothetical protein
MTGELDKLLAVGELQKAADLLNAQIDDIDRRLAKLESKEDWPAFFEAAALAPIAANIHPAPRMVQ